MRNSLSFRTFFTFSLSALALFLLPLSSFAARDSATHRPAGPGYRGAIIVDADTGKVLWEDNADELNPPASMTKLMTFAVLYDKLQAGTIKLSTPIHVTAADADMGGTQVYLREGETFPVEEMIYAMMIQSANDCAHALARSSAGSTEAFVKEMNAKAKAIGMTHTTFRSPHGLPPASRKIADGDLTTPRDFSLLCEYLLKNTNVLKYSSVQHRLFGDGIRSKDRVISMVNHNHLLGKVAGVDGFKTGYTKGAGYCLSTTAIRGGRRIIVITMGSADRKVRDKKIAELIELGFERLPALPAPAPVKKAATQTVVTPTVSAKTIAGQAK